MLYRFADLHGESRLDGSLLESAMVLVRREVPVKSGICHRFTHSPKLIFLITLALKLAVPFPDYLIFTNSLTVPTEWD